MAYYDALIAKWPSVSGADTATKLANLNAQTVTGVIPTTFQVTGSQIMNCLDFTEFNSLTAAKQTTILQLCGVSSMIGGQNTFVGKLFANYYSAMLAGPTITAFVALAQATVQPWWQANGYSSPIGPGDLGAAGGLT